MLFETEDQPGREWSTQGHQVPTKGQSGCPLQPFGPSSIQMPHQIHAVAQNAPHFDTTTEAGMQPPSVPQVSACGETKETLWPDAAYRRKGQTVS